MNTSSNGSPLLGILVIAAAFYVGRLYERAHQKSTDVDQLYKRHVSPVVD